MLRLLTIVVDVEAAYTRPNMVLDPLHTALCILYSDVLLARDPASSVTIKLQFLHVCYTASVSGVKQFFQMQRI